MKKLPWLGLLAVVSLSCASSALPPPLSPEERELAETVRFPATVGVAEFEYPAYSERLVEALRATGMFEAVGPLDAVEDPDLVAVVRRPIYGTASLAPLLTIVTLGVIPTTGDEEWGDSFYLVSPDSRDSNVAIDFSYTGPTTLGWFALLRALSPRYAHGTPRDHPRFRRAFAAAIAARAREIEALLDERTEGR